jgi:hypothetical protein
MSRTKSAAACVGSAGALLLSAFGVTLLSGPAPKAQAALPVATIATVIPAQGGYGTIKGRLVWGGATAPKPEMLKPTKDTTVCNIALVDHKLVVDAKTKGIPFGFAYLPAPKGKNAEAVKELVKKAPRVVIDQKNCEFLPYSTALHKDQILEFKSSDAIGHNARYAGFTNGSKNVALPPNGKYDAKLVAEKRQITLNCDIHPWMKGVIMVFDHPFFAVTKDDGSFEIQGVPAGPQNLIVWQDAVGYVTSGGNKGMAVDVKANGTTDVGDIVLDPNKVKK